MRFPLVKVEDFCRTGSGATPARDNPDYYGGNIPWIKSGELRETLITNSEEFVTENALQRTALKLIPPGAILIAMYGATVGRVGLLGIEATTNQAVCHIVPDANIADTRYLYHFMQSHAAEFVRRGVGGAQPNISQGMVRETLVPLPPLEEQKRIAAILDQADALRRLRARALTRLNALGQAIFHEMFVNRSDVWPKHTIEALVENARTGPFGSQLLSSELVDDGIPVLGIDNVVSNEFAWGKSRFISPEKYVALRRYTVLPGDILITIMGTIGRCIVVPSGIPTAINTKHICCLTPKYDLIGSEFLRAAFLYHPGILKQLGVQTKGAIMPGLNMGIIKGLVISLPPLALQEEFAERLSTATSVLHEARRQEGMTQTLFTSLQHRAFRGEL